MHKQASCKDVQALFEAYAWDKDGFLQGAEAVSFFQRTNLSGKQLRKVSPGSGTGLRPGCCQAGGSCT